MVAERCGHLILLVEARKMEGLGENAELSLVCLQRWLPEEQVTPWQVTRPWTLVGEDHTRLERAVAENTAGSC